MSLKIQYWNCAAGFLKKFDYVKDLIVEHGVYIFFVAESEIRYDDNLDIFSLCGYEVVVSETITSRGKARILCFKRNTIKIIGGLNPQNDIIALESDGRVIVGIYRGFKLFQRETSISNYERIIADLKKFDYTKEIIICGDLNISLMH